MKVLSSERPAFAATQAGLALSGPVTAVTLVAVALLLAPGVVAFGPVFGGIDGYLAAGGGAVLGLVLGFLARRFRWALASTAAAVVAAYLLFGGALALRRTTIAGVIPTPDTLVRLVPLSVQAWRDLLTVNPPAGDFTGPAIVPFLAGLVLATVTTWLALDERRYLGALVPSLALLVVGILWGLDDAPAAAWLGAAYGVVALLWAAYRREAARRFDTEEIIGGEGVRGLDGRRLASATGIVAVAAAASLLAGPLLGGLGIDRFVLRRTVQPPLTLTDYASPLTAYRHYEVDLKDKALFTVTGLPAGARVRLATLDAYDGRVYTVADASSGFVRVGERTGTSTAGPTATLGVTVAEYSGVWLPGGGDVRGLRFTGPQARLQADNLYYNAYGGTALTTAGVAQGDSYSVDVALPAADQVPEGAAVASASVPSLERVPDAISKVATDYTADATTPLEQLRALEKRLREGFYSDGSDNKSRAGHTAERVASMLTAPALIGDDEQYAVAMALMARQLGLPARVVLGFYPDADKTPAGDSLEVTGTMAHVWVEVPFEGAGWVAFDPTPDRDRQPQTQLPKPQDKPKPQVMPPPDPPTNNASDPLDLAGKRDENDKRGDDLWLRIAAIAGMVLGGLVVVAGPFVAIGAAKRRRRLRREHASEPVARFSGAWDELTDAATDLGQRLSPVATRRETAATLEAAYPDAGPRPLAAGVDAAVFGAAATTEEAASAAWTEMDRVLASMRGGVGRWRRFLAFCSLRSFGRPRLRLPALATGALRRSGKALP